LKEVPIKSKFILIFSLRKNNGKLNKKRFEKLYLLKNEINIKI
jgi:hypothetical protein